MTTCAKHCDSSIVQEGGVDSQAIIKVQSNKWDILGVPSTKESTGGGKQVGRVG